MVEIATTTPNADIELTRSLQYGTGGGRPLHLHLLKPTKRALAPLPVVMWVHGGAWRKGSYDSGISRLTSLVRRGFAGVSVEYRLSSEATFPAQIEDCKCAVRFLRAHAAELGLDPERIGVWGASAGGHLVALLGTAPDVPHMEGNGGLADHSSRVQAVCDWFGPTDFLQMNARPGRIDHDAPDSPESQLIGGPIQQHPDRCAAANPISYISGDEPPFLIVHGAEDQLVLREQSDLLYDALMRAGRDVTYHVIQGAGHGGPEFESEVVQEIVASFFTQQLQPEPVEQPRVDDSDGLGLKGKKDGETHQEQSGTGSLVHPVLVTRGSRLWADSDHTAVAGMTYTTFQSASVGGPVSYLLWLPPDYEVHAEGRHPVIYWLHGLGGNQRVGIPFVERYARAVQEGIAAPAIIVLVNGLPASMYTDSADERAPVERVIIEDLIPHVDGTYRTLAGREGRAIEGHSMGGFGAARLGFKYPDLFGSVGISAGALHTAETLATRRPALFQGVYGGDKERFDRESPWTLAARNAARIRGRTKVRIVVGVEDGLLEANTRFHEHLDRLGIEHTFEVVPGAGHSFVQLTTTRGIAPFAFYRDLGLAVPERARTQRA